MNVKAVASYFISRSSELAENDLTNLKLQKILFYAQAESLKKTDNVLFRNKIEAWSYGPVIQDIYHWLKGCGAYPITTFDVETDFSSLSQDDKDFLGRVWDTYSKYSAIFLVKKTHEEGSPWEVTFDGNRNKTIPIDLIKKTALANEWK